MQLVCPLQLHQSPKPTRLSGAKCTEWDGVDGGKCSIWGNQMLQELLPRKQDIKNATGMLILHCHGDGTLPWSLSLEQQHGAGCGVSSGTHSHVKDPSKGLKHVLYCLSHVSFLWGRSEDTIQREFFYFYF